MLSLFLHFLFFFFFSLFHFTSRFFIFLFSYFLFFFFVLVLTFSRFHSNLRFLIFSFLFFSRFFFYFFVSVNMAQQQTLEWTYGAALHLIHLRKYYHNNFKMVSNNRHRIIWTMIANTITTATGLAVSEAQCHTKWYLLKYEYENLVRLYYTNPYNQPIMNLTLHDQMFF